MKIYVAASIRGGRDDQPIYEKIIQMVSEYGTVLTELFGSSTITSTHGTGKDVEAIFLKDMGWIEEADAIVAEVTQPSLGVGYEIGRAETMRKPILCLYRTNAERTLSAMIAGNPKVTVQTYTNVEEVKDILATFFAGLTK